jgi:hypothetical protein
MTHTTRRLRDLKHAGVDICLRGGVAIGRAHAAGPGYCVYHEDGMCLEAGSLTAAEVAVVQAFGVRVES